MKKTVTLNMAAALVKFLQQQYIRRDGVETLIVRVGSGTDEPS